MHVPEIGVNAVVVIVSVLALVSWLIVMAIRKGGTCVPDVNERDTEGIDDGLFTEDTEGRKYK